MHKETNIETFYHSFMNGAREVIRNRKHLNQINVFPVPDGDTGSNLTSLMQSILNYSELKTNFTHTLDSIADSAIIGARGNSGLIFAQFIQGLCQVLSEENDVTTLTLEKASKRGVELAYSSLENPVEGTMLTSMKAFHKSLENQIGANIEVALENSVEDVENSVLQSTELLNVLKKSNVVDSGAKGFFLFLKGFVEGVLGKMSKDVEENETLIYEHQENHAHDGYRYCTEALMSIKASCDFKDILKDKGDSIVVVQGKNKIRIHVHTNSPQEVFEILSDYGTFHEQKVDDMEKQQVLVHERKYKIALVTDSIADLPIEFIENEQIQVIPLNILIDEEPYIDKLTITNEKLLKLARERNVYPKSSQPTIKQVRFILDYLLNYYEQIIIIPVSSVLSGTYNVFKSQMSSFNQGENRVHLIDSMQNSVAQGLLVYKAAEMIKKGETIQSIVNHIETLKKGTKILVGIHSLDNMIASGRLSVRAGAVLKRIKMKPIITLKEGDGAIEKVAFGFNSALNKIVKHLVEVNEKNELNYAITYVDNYENGVLLKEMLEAALDKPCEFMVKSSSIIAAGAGSGAVAVAYTLKE
ncbi:MAG: DegV family EDD domain-containing protein [Clostridia bacterium]|nr:DegV family EDD domain-containing protein [Clostridia bacterium]